MDVVDSKRFIAWQVCVFVLFNAHQNTCHYKFYDPLNWILNGVKSFVLNYDLVDLPVRVYEHGTNPQPNSLCPVSSCLIKKEKLWIVHVVHGQRL